MFLFIRIKRYIKTRSNLFRARIKTEITLVPFIRILRYIQPEVKFFFEFLLGQKRRPCRFYPNILFQQKKKDLPRRSFSFGGSLPGEAKTGPGRQTQKPWRFPWALLGANGEYEGDMSEKRLGAKKRLLSSHIDFPIS
ncbi:MAG: hypothetical protein LBE31_02680 [Deltaproteobacteria bacterium]|jgi:hypothetical protein|nr:hypothetical protein [Deltaproteobacteria bacterium]